MMTRITEAEAQAKIQDREPDEIDCDYPDCKSYYWNLDDECINYSLGQKEENGPLITEWFLIDSKPIPRQLD
jgi:hypothetical protein